MAHQDSLRVRPLLWSALAYLRGAWPERYSRELVDLWLRSPRYHVRLLVAEFVGRQPNPDETEASVLLPLLRDAELGPAALAATAGSPGWFNRLVQGHLQAAMQGTSSGAACSVLEAAWRIDRERVLELLEQQWLPVEEKRPLVLQTLGKLRVWCDRALNLAQSAAVRLDVAPSGAQRREPELATLAWQLSRVAPAYAVRLLAFDLNRGLDRLLLRLPRTPPPARDAPPAEWATWYCGREPHQSIEKEIERASQFSVLIELAKRVPGDFLEHLLSWFARLLDPAAEVDGWHAVYRDDGIIDAQRVEGLVREVPDSLAMAAEKLASEAPSEFLAVVERWKDSDLLSVHLALSYGMARLAGTAPQAVIEYLVGDPRRLALGTLTETDTRTVLVIQAVSRHLSAADFRRLEAAILSSAPSSVVADRSARSRRAAMQLNRIHRLRLLKALPESSLSEAGRALVDGDSRTFSDDELSGARSSGLRLIGSPMTAQQMACASDDDILGLFEELDDGTGFDHPRRHLEGGAVQAAREFAQVATEDPERAVRLIERLKPEVNEVPVGDAIRALADTPFPTDRLERLVMTCHERGFRSEAFRCDVARALEKRTSGSPGLSEASIEMLAEWLADVPPGAKTIGPRNGPPGRTAPPFLWGWSGAMVLPGGRYPALRALTTALLLGTNPQANRWLALLEAHGTRNESPDLWVALSHHLPPLARADHSRATSFLETLFERYPEVLFSGSGVRLVAYASYWAPSNVVEGWVERLGASEWEHGPRAAGELLGHLMAGYGPAAWTVKSTEKLLAGGDANLKLAGFAGMVVRNWPSPRCRRRCTDLLLRLCGLGVNNVLAEIGRGLNARELVADDDSAKVLGALSAHPVACASGDAGRSVAWIAGLVHAYPKQVMRFCDALLAELERTDVETRLAWRGSEELVNLALTLQRLPGCRTQGLDIFERLLRAGVFHAQWALKEVDQEAMK